VSEVDNTSKNAAKLLKVQDAADYHLEVEFQEQNKQQLPREVLSQSVNTFAKKMVNEPVILKEAEVRDQKGEVIPFTGIVFHFYARKFSLALSQVFSSVASFSSVIVIFLCYSKIRKKNEKQNKFSKIWSQKRNRIWRNHTVITLNSMLVRIC
jgi:hypothetical protein